MITDQNDNDSQSPLSDVVDDSTKTETIVYCLGIGAAATGERFRLVTACSIELTRLISGRCG